MFLALKSVPPAGEQTGKPDRRKKYQAGLPVQKQKLFLHPNLHLRREGRSSSRTVVKCARLSTLPIGIVTEAKILSVLNNCTIGNYTKKRQLTDTRFHEKKIVYKPSDLSVHLQTKQSIVTCFNRSFFLC